MENVLRAERDGHRQADRRQAGRHPRRRRGDHGVRIASRCSDSWPISPSGVARCTSPKSMSPAFATRSRTRGSPISSTISTASMRSPRRATASSGGSRTRPATPPRSAPMTIRRSSSTCPCGARSRRSRLSPIETIHRRFVQRRKEWFELFGAAYLALWWVEEGAFPDAAEGRRRLAHLDRFGPTPFAFTFKRRFPPGPALPVAEVGEDRSVPEPYRSCG